MQSPRQAARGAIFLDSMHYPKSIHDMIQYIVTTNCVDTRSRILCLFFPLAERVGKTTTDHIDGAESQ
jgi:hypothetical protein